MRYKFYLSITCVFVILLFYVLNRSYKSVDRGIEENIETILWQAISLEGTNRLKSLDVRVVRFSESSPVNPIPEEDKGALAKSETFEHFRRYSEGAVKPKNAFVRDLNMDQSYLCWKSPIRIEQLDSIFQLELINSNIKTQTFIYFNDKINNRTGHSRLYSSSLFPQKDICLDSIQLGVHGELELKAYIHYPYVYVMKEVSKKSAPHTAALVGIFIFIWGIRYYIRYGVLKKERHNILSTPPIFILPETHHLLDTTLLLETLRESKEEEPEPPVVERGPIYLDEKTQLLYFYDSELYLSKQNFQILKILLESEGHAMGKEDLADKLWGKLYSLKERQTKCMQRFRKAIEPIPELQLILERGVCYRLLISERATAVTETPATESDSSSEELETPSVGSETLSPETETPSVESEVSSLEQETPDSTSDADVVTKKPAKKRARKPTVKKKKDETGEKNENNEVTENSGVAENNEVTESEKSPENEAKNEKGEKE